MRTMLLVFVLLGGTMPCFAQFSFSQLWAATGLQKQAKEGISSVNEKALSAIKKKYDKLDASIEKQSQKMLSRLQKKEDKLRHKLQKRDSLKAAQLFGDAEEQYAGLRNKLSQPFDSLQQFPLKEYIPGVDSLQTALNFLKGQGVSLPEEKLAAAGKAGAELKELQDKLEKAGDVEAFVKSRERQLKEGLANSGLAKGLKSINKEAFYYSQRLREYKEALKNPEKLEEKVLNAVRNSGAFLSFMKKNSYLAKLFPAPENYGTPAALAGLQTRASVQGALQQRFGTAALGAASSEASAAAGSGAGAAMGYLQQQMSAAQAQLGALKDKMSQLGISGGSSDMTIPDFKPNSQHTKSFFKRIQYSANMQSEGAKNVIPPTSDLALMLGYKLNDKSTIGIGASYRVGWGHEGFQHITITHEGVGLRSFVDIKARGSFWLSGGYEMNYQQSFAHYRQLYNLNMWQRSGLIGITKKYKVGKKENNMQVLWDFLSYSQVPRTGAIKFRVGFGL